MSSNAVKIRDALKSIRGEGSVNRADIRILLESVMGKNDQIDNDIKNIQENITQIPRRFKRL